MTSPTEAQDLKALDIAGLREKALAAMPGPWALEYTRTTDIDGRIILHPSDLRWVSGGYDRDYPDTIAEDITDPDNAAFIAAFNPATALALLSRIESDDATIAEREAEIERLKRKVGDNVYRGKLLEKVRRVLVNIGIVDEGGRYYFESMNQGERLKELREEVNAFGWDRIMTGRDYPDLVEMARSANARADAAEAEVARLKEALAPFVPQYEPWMDRHADHFEGSVHRLYTFGQLRAARAALQPKDPDHAR